MKEKLNLIVMENKRRRRSGSEWRNRNTHLKTFAQHFDRAPLAADDVRGHGIIRRHDDTLGPTNSTAKTHDVSTLIAQAMK